MGLRAGLAGGVMFTQGMPMLDLPLLHCPVALSLDSCWQPCTRHAVDQALLYLEACHVLSARPW